jgi:hypothetical protein
LILRQIVDSNAAPILDCDAEVFSSRSVCFLTQVVRATSCTCPCITMV